MRNTPKAEKLELVHTDVWGKTLVPSLGGSLYFVTFINDSNRKVWAYYLKHKSYVFMAQVENESGRKLKCLKFNEGDEYYNGIFEEFCASRGIRRVKTIPGNSQQKRVAERMNRTILECARSMHIHAGLHKKFQKDIVDTTAYLINRGPSVPLNYGIPEET